MSPATDHGFLAPEPRVLPPIERHELAFRLANALRAAVPPATQRLELGSRSSRQHPSRSGRVPSATQRLELGSGVGLGGIERLVLGRRGHR